MPGSMERVAPAVEGAGGGPVSGRQLLPGSVARFLERHEGLGAIAIVMVCSLSLRLILFVFSDVLVVRGISAYWPVCGMVTGVLLLNRRSDWPWIVLSFVLVDYDTEAGTVVGRGVIVLGNVAEVLIPALLLPACTTLESWMRERALLRRFVVYGILLGPLSCAIPVSLYAHYAQHEGFWSFLLRWMPGDALGTTIGLPLVLTLHDRRTYAMFRGGEILETMGLMGLVGAASWLIFYRFTHPLGFMMLPVLLLIAFRRGFGGSVHAVNFLALIAALATLSGKGPFYTGPYPEEAYGIVLLRLYLIVSMLICLPVCLVLIERRHFEEQLNATCEQLQLLTIRDGLTGVANRRCFDETLDQEWRRAIRNRSSVSLLLIDVDQFKHFNDTLGHVEGDECLCRVAEVIRSVPLRVTDLVARYGGEEFAMVMPNMGLQGAERMAEMVRGDCVGGDRPRGQCAWEGDGVDRMRAGVSRGRDGGDVADRGRRRGVVSGQAEGAQSRGVCGRGASGAGNSSRGRGRCLKEVACSGERWRWSRWRGGRRGGGARRCRSGCPGRRWSRF